MHTVSCKVKFNRIISVDCCVAIDITVNHNRCRVVDHTVIIRVNAVHNATCADVICWGKLLAAFNYRIICAVALKSAKQIIYSARHRINAGNKFVTFAVRFNHESSFTCIRKNLISRFCRKACYTKCRYHSKNYCK